MAREAAFYDALVNSRDPTAADPQSPDAWDAAILEAIGAITRQDALELDRLLRPGGRGVFIEMSGLNPLLLAGRAQSFIRDDSVRCVGTEDERPVSRSGCTDPARSLT